VARLAGAAGAEFVTGRAAVLDLEAQVAIGADGHEYGFDFVSIDIGATPLAPAVPGLRDFALLSRPHELFLEGWDRVRELAREGGLRRLAVVGGEAAAVELMLAMQHRLRTELPAALFAACGFSLVTPAARLLAAGPPSLGLALEAVSAARGVSLLRGAAVVEVRRDAVLLANGAQLASDLTIWAEGAHPARWLAASGLDCDAAGAMRIDERLRSPSHKRVFGAGDCTVSGDAPEVPAAGRARRQGPGLALALRQALAGEVPPPWAAPPPRLLSVTLGSREALLLRGTMLWTWPRGLLWHLKSRAERRYFARFHAGG
jgi:selenide, water dikinase